MRELMLAWLDAKQREARAVNDRREIEDKLASLYDVPEDLDGTKTFKHDNVVLKIVGRMNRTIDGDKLQEIAREHGLTQHLSTLFRWKPDLDARAWKNAHEEIKTPLLAAITTKPGRPSFAITINEDK